MTLFHPIVRVVLNRPRDPNNIAACARALGNFGLSDLVVIDPYEPIWKEARAAPGAENVLAQARAVLTWSEAVHDCAVTLGTSSFHQRPTEQSVIELPNLHRYLSSYPASQRIAFVFGSERSGLSNEELARCQAVLRIPTHRGAPSMNLGQAVAITLYEWRRSGWAEPLPSQRAPAEELETFLNTLASVGEAADYPAGQATAARLGKIRRAFQEASLPPATVRFLLSFTRRLLKLLPAREKDGLAGR